jgi:O-acetyl-ADP-ribose deacetylase (regulator of RNase III)
LRLAIEHNVKTIAFPAISCGVYGYPIEAACKVAVDTVCDFLKNNQTPVKVIFILFSSQDKNVYDDYLSKL